MQIRMIALAAALVAAGAAQAAVSFDANIEHDVKKVGKAGVEAGGRVELNALATLAKSGDSFVNAKATVEVPTAGGDKVNIADAWVQVGNSMADLKLGRQEAVDLFPLGKDVIVAGRDGQGYNAGALRGRVTTGKVHAVAGYNAAPGLRLEVGVQSGKSGVRPTAVYTAGPLTVRAGFESFKVDGEKVNGTGLSLGYAIDASTSVNANYAKTNASNANSFALNATFGAAGVGMIQDKADGMSNVNTFYAAYTLPLLDVKGATLTPAFSTSKVSGGATTDAFAVRVNFGF